jgi:hypothetical protein
LSVKLCDLKISTSREAGTMGAGMYDKAIDITLYALGGISLAVSTALVGLSILF